VKVRNLGHRATRLFATHPSEPQKPSTKTLLIDAAEMLFGRHGFDAVSLREIAAMAGQANKSVTQYHFRDKAGLIVAILRDRIGRIEAVRCEYLQNLKQGDPNYSRALMKTILLPVLAIRNSDGEHPFCKFVLQLLLQPRVTGNPLSTLYKPTEGNYVSANVPIDAEAASLFFEHYKEIPKPLLLDRMRFLNKMFLAAVVEHDNARLVYGERMSAEFDSEPIIDMCIAAVAAPVESRHLSRV
jgi:AcrR family transcriptional regulator